LSDN
jgi:hypothetical protein